jgi:hypothetical protein
LLTVQSSGGEAEAITRLFLAAKQLTEKGFRQILTIKHNGHYRTLFGDAARALNEDALSRGHRVTSDNLSYV